MATEKDISKYLLNHYQIEYTLLIKPGAGLYSRMKAMIVNTIRCIYFIRNNKIDIMVSRVSPYLSVAGFLLRKPHIALADTESSGIYNKLFCQFVSAILTPKSFKKILRSDQIRFDGNIELFYLHPNRFVPDKNILKLLGLDNEEPYVVMRFVSWAAYHDKGLTGFTDANKIKAVKDFLRFAKVFISSEKGLPKELEPYCIKVSPEKIHDILANASLFFGESATMASESAVLGIPAIYLNENWVGYIVEEAEYELLFPFREGIEDQARSIQKGVEILSKPGFRKRLVIKHKKYLENTIDVTEFLIWFIENYPDSFKIMKNNPEYQERFK